MIRNMILIFIVDSNWNIGYKGDMLFKISEDLKRFKRLTVGNIIIMGRKTFDALPNRKALPDRINIVLTRDKDFYAEDVIPVHSTEELFNKLEELNPDRSMEFYLIGGGNLGRQLIDHCDRAEITKIFKGFKNADVGLPDLDLDDNWKIIRESEVHDQDGVKYQYVDYVRKAQ